MSGLNFVFKKLYRNNSFLIVMLTAIILSGANILNMNSRSSLESHSITDLDLYYRLEVLLTPPIKSVMDVSFTQSAGQQHMSQLIEEVTSPTGEFESVGMYSKNSQYFSYLLEALEMDNVEITSLDKADIDYGLHASRYIEQKQRQNESYQPSGAIDYLIEDNWLLYGTIPILIISLLAIRLVSEDFQLGSLIFNRTLPVKRSQTLLAHGLAILVCLIVYTLLTVVTTVFLVRMNGDGFGDWFFPIRIMSEVLVIQPFIIVWLRMIFVFFLKFLLVLGFGLVLANCFRQVHLSLLFQVFVVSILTFLTTYVSDLQVNWNPFYFNYQQQLIGTRSFATISSSGGVLLENLTSYIYLSWFLLILVFWGLADFLYRKNELPLRKSRLEAKESNLWRHPFYILAFEGMKLNHIVPKSTVWFSLITLNALLLFIIGISDNSQENSVLTPLNAIQETQDVVEVLEQGVRDLETMMADESISFEEKQINQMLFEDTQYYLDTLVQFNETLLDRQHYFQTMSSEQFYRSFKKDVEHHYNANNKTVDDSFEYFPKYDYYQNGNFPTRFGYHVSTERLNEMIKREIRPIANAEIQWTPYDKAVEPSDQLADRLNYQLADRSAMGIWHRLITVYRLDIMLIGLVVLFCGHGYTIERGQGHSSLSWQYTLPESRQKLLFNKWGASVLKALQLIGGTSLLVFIAGVLQDGLGESNLPVIYYEQVLSAPNESQAFQGTYQWLALGEVVGKSILLLVFATLFVVTLAIFLSTFTKHILGICLNMILILGLGVFLLQSTILEPFNVFLPFMYLNTAAVLDGSLMFNSALTDVNLLLGYGVLFFWTIMVYMLTAWRIHITPLNS